MKEKDKANWNVKWRIEKYKAEDFNQGKSPLLGRGF